MTQRNAMNERNTEDNKTGVARKSAASAKPKAKAAASVYIESGKKTPEQKKAARKAAEKKERTRVQMENAKYQKVPTQRYKNLRRLWIGLLVVSVLACIGMFAYSTQSRDMSNPLYIFIIVVAYGCIFGAFYVDFSLIRKERRRYIEEVTSKSKEVRREEKAQKQAVLAEKRAAAERVANGETEETPAQPEKKGFFARFKK